MVIVFLFIVNNQVRKISIKESYSHRILFNTKSNSSLYSEPYARAPAWWKWTITIYNASQCQKYAMFGKLYCITISSNCLLDIIITGK